MDILHVEHELGESFVEDARLNLKGHLRALEPFLEPSERGLGLGGHVDSIDQRQKPCPRCKDGNDPQKRPHADAAGPHGGDFAVGRQPTQSDQNSHQHTHGNGVNQRHRHGEEEEFRDARQGGTVANHQFEDAAQVAREQHEGEHRDADQGMRGDLAQDVTGEDSHNGLREPSSKLYHYGGLRPRPFVSVGFRSSRNLKSLPERLPQ